MLLRAPRGEVQGSSREAGRGARAPPHRHACQYHVRGERGERLQQDIAHDEAVGSEQRRDPGVDM